MAELVQGRWGCNNDEAIQKRAHSGGKEDEFEACKILGWKDEIGKSRASWVIIKLTLLDHVKPGICRSRDYDITVLNRSTMAKSSMSWILYRFSTGIIFLEK